MKNHRNFNKICIFRLALLIIFVLSCFFYVPLNLYPFLFIKFYDFSILSSESSENMDDLFMEPYFYPFENDLLYKYMNSSTVYFEFGSGGTTHQAAKRRLKIYTVEAADCWVSQIKRDIEKIKKSLKKFDVDITYLVSDIQTEIDPPRENIFKYIKMYNHTKYNADLILINGRFNLACLMNVYQEIDNKTIVFLHQPENRDFKNDFIKFFDIIEKGNFSYVLRRKSYRPKLSEKALSDIENRDINYKNRLIDVLKYMKTNYNDLIEKYKNDENSNFTRPDHKQIWIFWWQGIEKAPEIVQICYRSILKHFKDGNITFITEKNYKEYTNIPEFIIEKLKAKKFTLTHFSDIVRESVLSTRGGLWLDATIFINNEIPDVYFNKHFYTLHAEDPFFITFGKWCGFTLSSYINEIVTRFCCDFFYTYWSKNNKLYDYFLIDYVMLFGCEYIPEFRKSVQSVPVTFQRFLDMHHKFADKYSPESFEKILNSSKFHKLSYKFKFSKKINNTVFTNFGYFIDHYKE